MKFERICFSKVCRKDFHTLDTLPNLKANERQYMLISGGAST